MRLLLTMKVKKKLETTYTRGAYMEKIKLYLDFDGVIMDTIRLTYKMLDEKNLQTQDEIRAFFRNIDWNNLLQVAPVLNDSINCIKKIIISGKFDVTILTHVNSKQEGIEKINFIEERIKGLEVIPCPKEIEKCDYVNPLDCILVDDYSNNLKLWQEKGGIAIKFSDNNKQSDDFVTITKLDQILNIDF